MLNFVTLFDKNYLSRGIALYNSLSAHCDNFILFILAMDKETEDYFILQKYSQVKIIPLKAIEEYYFELVDIKKERTRAEYCWTLTPYSIQYAIKNYNLDACTYIDADIYFFNNPKVLFDEACDNSVIITEHRYTPRCDQTETSGKYCVQFVYFKNDVFGSEALEWWRERCKEWCYARCEDGKFGDQKYLDDWTTRFRRVYVPTHIGCGLAPWNIQQYEVSLFEGTLYVQDKITKAKAPVIFFHFHGLKKVYADENKVIWLSIDNRQYILESNDINLIYTKYLNILSTNKNLHNIFSIKIKKPTFFRILYMICKDIIKSFCFIKKYKFYKEKLENEYHKEKSKLVTIYRKN